MSIFVILALCSSALMISAFASDDDIVEADETENPDDLEEPVESLDTGATFEQTEDGVIIEVGEDEERPVVAIHYLDTQDDENNFVRTDEVRYYLAPEETDWSSASWETQHEVPGGDTYEGPTATYDLEEFEASQGLELIGVVDVRGVPSETGDPDDRVGEVTSNVPIESYYLEAETDGDVLVSFLPEDYVQLREGVAEEPVSESTSGTAGTDWLTTTDDGIALSGLGGNDILAANNSNVTLNGGMGDDILEAIDAVGAVINGDDGNDAVIAHSSVGAIVDLGVGNDGAHIGSGTVYGGQGNDYITGNSDEVETLLYGETGNDRVIAHGSATTAYGGSGDDFVAANTGATAYGGSGNDHIQLDSGTTGFGGAGDDLITVWNFLHDDDGPTTLTGGDGADTIDVKVRNAFNGEADDIFLSVTDFDPDEDIFQIGSWGSQNEVNGIEIIEADDGSYSDVRVTYANTNGLEAGIAVIRLEGTTGISADQIVVT